VSSHYQQLRESTWSHLPVNPGSDNTHSPRTMTGLKLKFSLKLPRFLRPRRRRHDQHLNDSGATVDNYLDYYHTYVRPATTVAMTTATELDDLPGISDTAKILRFLLSGEEDEEGGVGTNNISYDDIIRCAEDYDSADVAQFLAARKLRGEERKTTQSAESGCGSGSSGLLPKKESSSEVKSAAGGGRRPAKVMSAEAYCQLCQPLSIEFEASWLQTSRLGAAGPVQWRASEWV
jgi:hypothetical protein